MDAGVGGGVGRRGVSSLLPVRSGFPLPSQVSLTVEINPQDADGSMTVMHTRLSRGRGGEGRGGEEI